MEISQAEIVAELRKDLAESERSVKRLTDAAKEAHTRSTCLLNAINALVQAYGLDAED